jgi:preprotein translocase subunit SecE
MAAVAQGIKEGLETARTFLQEALAEIRRVQWPSRNEVRAATLIVVFLVGFTALYLFVVDTILSWVFQVFLGT